MTFPTHAGQINYAQSVWLALAHEKVGLFDGAIRFANSQLELNVLKGGNPLTKWPQVIALACKGRVFAKLNRHDEALVAFQAAITTSKQSYSLMEAFALRELANYVGIGDAAVQAGKDLEVKLDTFNGRMTRKEFDRLTIAPVHHGIVAVDAPSLPSQFDANPKVQRIKRARRVRAARQLLVFGAAVAAFIQPDGAGAVP